MGNSEHPGNLSNTERAWSAVLGASLSLLALRRGSVIGRSIQATAGAALLARAFAGHCAVKAALGGQQPDRNLPGSSGRAAQSQAVDESVAESFPASDPPASRLPDEPPSNAQAKWDAARAAGDGPRSADGQLLTGEPFTGD